MTAPAQLCLLGTDLVSRLLDDATETEIFDTIHANTSDDLDHDRLILFLAGLSASLVERLAGGRELFAMIVDRCREEATVEGFRDELNATLGSEPPATDDEAIA